MEVGGCGAPVRRRFALQQGKQLAQLVAYVLELGAGLLPAIVLWGGQFRGQERLVGLQAQVGWNGGFAGKHALGASDGVALFMEQALDAECHFDVAPAVEALAGAAFAGVELGELRLPEAQDVGGHAA